MSTLSNVVSSSTCTKKSSRISFQKYIFRRETEFSIFFRHSCFGRHRSVAGLGRVAAGGGQDVDSGHHGPGPGGHRHQLALARHLPLDPLEERTHIPDRILWMYHGHLHQHVQHHRELQQRVMKTIFFISLFST